MREFLHFLIGWIVLSLLGAAILFFLSGCQVYHTHNMRLPSPRQPGPALPGPICVGDTVRLRSGGPLMMVRELRCRRGGCCEAWCEWMGVALVRGAWFDVAMLQRE